MRLPDGTVVVWSTCVGLSLCEAVDAHSDENNGEDASTSDEADSHAAKFVLCRLGRCECESCSTVYVGLELDLVL